MPEAGAAVPYLDMTREELSRLLLCLLVEEALRQRLAAFRVEPSENPVEPGGVYHDDQPIGGEVSGMAFRVVTATR